MNLVEHKTHTFTQYNIVYSKAGNNLSKFYLKNGYKTLIKLSDSVLVLSLLLTTLRTTHLSLTSITWQLTTRM